MTFPVIFTMLSNHYSMAYGHPYNWVILILLVAFGFCLRHLSLSEKGRWAVIPAIAAAAVMLLWTGKPNVQSKVGSGEPVSFEQVRGIIQNRCLACHSSHPTDNVFTVAPSGVVLENPDRIKSLIPRIHERVVVTKTMPLANKTGMTDDERETLGRWIEQGAHIDGLPQ
jgi:uncharacterized membrane protein